MNPFPLNPTIGTIPDHQIIGREQEIIKILRLIKGQSISIEQIRRMGKSLLLKKLAYLCNENKLPKEFENEKIKAKYFSFQGKENLGEVIDLLIKELETLKEWYQIDFTKTYDFVRKIIGSTTIDINDAKFTFNLPEYKKSWKEIFFKALDDIADSQKKSESKLILIFDELPIMLWDWYKAGKHDEALELLDILRERRQDLESKGIRFIYCGSIGIKVVLKTFKEEFGYTGEATNDMEEFGLDTLIKSESDLLCECYTLSGMKIIENDKPDIWNLVYKLTNGLPFYISKIFNIIQTEFDLIINEENITKSYDLLMNSTLNHQAFNQLKDRISIYYPNEQKEIAIELLKILSKEDDFILEEVLVTRLNNESSKISEVLYQLFSDHYLVREIKDDKRAFKFKYEIFKKWWRINIA
jgi:hypothetical protein